MRTILFLVILLIAAMTPALSTTVVAQDLPNSGEVWNVTVSTSINVRSDCLASADWLGSLVAGDSVTIVGNPVPGDDGIWVRFQYNDQNACALAWSSSGEWFMENAGASQVVPTPESLILTVCHEYNGGTDTIYQVGEANAAGELCAETGLFITQAEAQALALGAGGGPISFDHTPFTNGGGDSFAPKWWWESLCSKLPQQTFYCAQDPDQEVVRPVRALEPFVAANGNSTDSLAWNLFVTIKCSLECDAGQVRLMKPTHIQFVNNGTQTAMFELTVWQDTSCLLDPLGSPCELENDPYWNPVNSVPGSNSNALFVNGRDVNITSDIISNIDGSILNREAYPIKTVDYSTECTAPTIPATLTPDDALAPKEWQAIAPATCQVDKEHNFFRWFLPGTNLVYKYTIEVPPGSYADWWVGQIILEPEQVIFGTDAENPDGSICISGENLLTCSRLTLAEYLAQVG